MEPTETALVVPIPSLQDFVAKWRPRVDAIAPTGVPAHVTLLYPFLDPPAISPVIDELEAFFAAQPGFSYSLDTIGWFDDEVVYVNPTPSESFQKLTDLIEARWGLPPYGGNIPDPVPHVTIGYSGTEEDMQGVANAAKTLLPINDQYVTEVWLLQGTPDPPRWTHTHTFRLSSGRT